MRSAEPPAGRLRTALPAAGGLGAAAHWNWLGGPASGEPITMAMGRDRLPRTVIPCAASS
ncbi:MAG: hypothetical protein LBI84_07235 [Propionibacteriaceae bacterium]|nr:hypothetical protein [Propionibacteriaceae bacterium]